MLLVDYDGRALPVADRAVPRELLWLVHDFEVRGFRTL